MSRRFPGARYTTKEKLPGCYCETVTGLHVCPVCNKQLGATVAVVTAPPRNATPAPTAINTWDRLNPTQRAHALKGIRDATARNAHNVASGILFGLVGDEDSLKWLIKVDADAAQRGYMLRAETDVMRIRVTSAIHKLGFNPYKYDSKADQIRANSVLAQPQPQPQPQPQAKVIPITRPPAPLPAPPKALGDGGEPLKSGDWARLGQMVASGQLTADDAKAIGEQWMKYGVAK